MNSMIRPDTSTLLPLTSYDRIIIMFSGGKDSTACALDLLETLDQIGAQHMIDRIELWHQLVDGAPEEPTFMDWPVTHAYCEAVASALGLPIRFQWREGGFLREMNRDGTATAPVTVANPDGSRTTNGGKGPTGTRGKFPQVSGDLSVRWCSAYLKIDVGARAITADPALQSGNILVITGERREESGNRARYATVEKHRTSNSKRRVDQWRSVLEWSEAQVWAIIQRWGIVPHPCYYVGYGRASCGDCIFNGPDERATSRALNLNFQRVAERERQTGHTIHRSKTMDQISDAGQVMVSNETIERYAEVLGASHWHGPIRVESDRWELPAGAYKHTMGPT